MAIAFATPNQDQLYEIGKELAPRLEPITEWKVIADELGVTRERAYKIGVTALGRLAFHLRKNLPLEAFDD